jgi:hypothetical protein
VHRRVCRSKGRYFTLAGDVVVARSLYRATRSGPVVDPSGVRVARSRLWLLPQPRAIAHLLQQGTVC